MTTNREQADGWCIAYKGQLRPVTYDRYSPEQAWGKWIASVMVVYDNPVSRESLIADGYEVVEVKLAQVNKSESK